MQFESPAHHYSTPTIIICILGITFFIFQTYSDYLYEEYSDSSTHNLTIFFLLLTLAKLLRDSNQLVNSCMLFISVICLLVKIYVMGVIGVDGLGRLFTHHKGYLASSAILLGEIYTLHYALTKERKMVVFRAVDEDEVETQVGNEGEE